MEGVKNCPPVPFLVQPFPIVLYLSSILCSDQCGPLEEKIRKVMEGELKVIVKEEK